MLRSVNGHWSWGTLLLFGFVGLVWAPLTFAKDIFPYFEVIDWEWAAVGSDGTVSILDWQILDSEHSPQGPGQFWLRTRLPALVEVDACLNFQRMFGNFELYQDSRLVYQYGQTDRIDFSHYMAASSHVIALPDQSGSRSILLKINSVENRVGFIGAVRYGQTWSIFSAILRQELLPIITFYLFVCSGLALLLLYCFQPAELGNLQAGIFCMSMGGFSLMYATTLPFLLFEMTPSLRSIYSRIGILFVSNTLYFLAAFIDTAVTRKQEPLIRLCRRIFMLYFMALLLLEASGIMWSFTFVILTKGLHLFGGLLILCLIGLGRFQLRSQGKEKAVGIVMLGVLGFIGFAIHDLLRALKHVETPMNLLAFGELIFLSSILVVLARRFAEVYRLNIVIAATQAKLEAELRGSEKVRTIYDHIQMGIFTFDDLQQADGQFSARLPQILQVKPEFIPGAEILGLMFDRAKPGRDDQERLSADLLQSFAVYDAGRFQVLALPHEYIIKLADGDHVLAVEWIPLLKDQGLKIDRIMVALRDLTARRSLEKALSDLSHMASLGKMSLGIGLEIDTSLARFEQLMDEVRLHFNQGEYNPVQLIAELKQLENLGYRIASVCSGMLTLTGNFENTAFDEVTAVQIIEETITLCIARIEAAGVELRQEFESEQLTLHCRPTQIILIVLELITNILGALEASGKHWIEITTYAVKGYAVIAVATNDDAWASNVNRQLNIRQEAKPADGQVPDPGLIFAQELAAENLGRMSLDQSSGKSRILLHVPLSSTTMLARQSNGKV